MANQTAKELGYAENAEQEIQVFVQQMQAYSHDQHEGTRIISLLILRDLYAFMAFKAIQNNDFSPAILFLTKAVNFYKTISETPRTVY